MFDGYTGGGSREVADGLMNIGDVGHLDAAGRLFIDGRDDDMILSGGENVFPQEVEDVLAGHPQLADAAVIGVEDPDFGQRLRAFAVARDGEQATEDELTAYLRERLARYKLPREIVFLDAIPRNPTGKVLKRALRDKLSGLGGSANSSAAIRAPRQPQSVVARGSFTPRSIVPTWFACMLARWPIASCERSRSRRAMRGAPRAERDRSGASRTLRNRSRIPAR